MFRMATGQSCMNAESSKVAMNLCRALMMDVKTNIRKMLSCCVLHTCTQHSDAHNVLCTVTVTVLEHIFFPL